MGFHGIPNSGDQAYFLNCVDPGGDTGMSLFHITPRSFKLLDYETIAYNPAAGEMPTSVLTGWRLDYPGIHHLLYEDFHSRNNSAAKDLTALKVLGAIDQVIYDRDLYDQVHKQEPVEAKHMVSDEILEKLDLHLGHSNYQRHVRDANRHGVAHLARLRYLPVCEVAYPRGGGRLMNRIRPGSHP